MSSKKKAQNQAPAKPLSMKDTLHQSKLASARKVAEAEAARKKATKVTQKNLDFPPPPRSFFHTSPRKCNTAHWARAPQVKHCQWAVPQAATVKEVVLDWDKEDARVRVRGHPHPTIETINPEFTSVGLPEKFPAAASTTDGSRSGGQTEGKN